MTFAYSFFRYDKIVCIFFVVYKKLKMSEVLVVKEGRIFILITI